MDRIYELIIEKKKIELVLDVKFWHKPCMY